MSQAWPTQLDTATDDGTSLAVKWNAFDVAHKSGQLGTTRPGGITKGGLWSRDNGDGTVSLLIYDGAQDVEVATVQRTLAVSDWEAGTSTTESLVSPAKIRDAIPPALNASGSAPIYACRAWVSFSATGAIRDSGNVSSVTDNGSGDYTINFSVSLPNSDYVVGGTSIWTNLNSPRTLALASLASKTTSSCRVYFLDDESGRLDPAEGFVSFIG